VEVTEVSNLILPEEKPTKPKKSYVPEGFDSAEDYLQDVRETYSLDLQADDENRRAAMEDKKFVAGEQWDPIVLQQRTGLPCLTINTIPQFTAQLVGDWRENRVAVKVIPAENGDKAVADIRSDLIRSIETRSRAPRVYNDAFESMIQCGDGAFRVAVQYASEDVFDQEIAISPIDDALSVVWDRLSIDPTGRDATHCFVDDILPLKEFKKHWPTADPSTLSSKEKRELTATGWIDDNIARVTEHWRMIERKKLLMMFEDGAIYTFEEESDPEDLDKYIERHGRPIRSRTAPCRYAQMHLVTGFKILSGPYEWKLDRLPIIRMSGRTVSMGDRRIRYGLVRFIKDVVRLRNFWRSTAAEQLGYAPKAQWIAPESAVEGREEQFRRAHLSRDPLLTYNDGAEAPPERVDPPIMQTALLNEAQINSQDIKDVTGIHDASLGIKSNETSGRAIMARQREGDVASLTYYDNGNASVLEAGDVINQLIGQIYDGTRIVRVIGEDESVKLVNINDDNDPSSPNIAVGKYDVAITTGASYTTRRVEAAEAMMEAVQVYPEIMQIAGDLVVKAQDWPGAEELSERLRKTVPPQFLSDKEKAEMGPGGPDMQAIMQQQAMAQEGLQNAQAELDKLQKENLTLKVKAEIEAKKIVIDEFRAETERLTALAAIAKIDKEHEIRQLEFDAEMENATHSKVMDIHDRVQATEDKTADREDAAEDRKVKAEAVKAKATSGSAKSTPSAD
jgi:hypothetical protein